MAVATTVAVLLILAVLTPKLGLPSYYVSLLSQTWIYGIAAVSLDVLVGFTGLVSFAQAAFFGVGSYIVAILATRYHVVAFGPALLFGLFGALVLAAFFGLLALRGEGVAFIIITLALNEIVWGLAYQWVTMSGGDNGITGFVRPKVGPIGVSGHQAFYYFCLAALVVSIVLLTALVRSPFGLTMMGVRERPRRMAALGYNVKLIRYLAFVVAGLFTGLAGVLFAYYNEFVGPVSLDLNNSVQILIMVILGGRGTLFGPLIGAGIVVFVSNALSNWTQRWETLLGALYVIILLWAPDGVVGLSRRAWAAFSLSALKQPAGPSPAEQVARGPGAASEEGGVPQ